MSDSLREYLEFYRDLGFTELYLPEGLDLKKTGHVPGRSAPAPKTTPGRAAMATTDRDANRPEAQRTPDAKKADKPVASGYRPPVDLFLPSEPRRSPLEVLEQIRTDIGDCTLCRLHEGRSKIVFGSGNPGARLVFVGEGPGADEDVQGLPFVGRAGQLLTQMIDNTASKEGIPITRADVYICNVVKCRPPGNRTPEPDEMEICGKFLERQLDAIRPKAICLLGATAARYLLGTHVGITKLRGQWQDWRGIPVMPTYHPSFLLRPYAQERKREAWEDFKKVLHYVYDPE
jgi:DNA polymerase